MAKLTENLDQFRTFLAPLALAPLTMSLILFSGQKGWANVINNCNVPGSCVSGASAEQGTAASGGSAASSALGSSDGLGSFATCGAKAAVSEATSNVAGTTSLIKADLENFNGEAKRDFTAYSKSPTTTSMAQAVNTCQTIVNGKAKALNAQINSLNTTMSSQFCGAISKYSSMSILHPIGDAHAFKNMADYSGSFDTGATALNTSVNSSFPTGGSVCEQQCTAAGIDQSLSTLCEKLASDYRVEAGQIKAITLAEKNEATAGWTAVKVGLGVAAVGATVGIVKAIQHHNDANRRAKIRADYANGIIHNPDGTTTDCKTSDNYMTTACQPVLMQYCSKPENQGGAGCGTFQQSYCALSTANASYCIASTAQTYCASYSASSPACQWLATRPTSCNGNPNPQDCLTSLTNTELQSQCGSYPNDPLCQAFEQGKVVNQAGTTALQNQPVANAGTTTASGATTLDQLINTPSTTTGSTSLASTAATTTTSATTGGALNTPTVRAQMRGQPVPNMFGADSQTIASLCTSGALACPP